MRCSTSTKCFQYPDFNSSKLRNYFFLQLAEIRFNFGKRHVFSFPVSIDEKITRLNDILTKLIYFESRVFDSKVDELSELINLEYSIEENIINDLSSNYTLQNIMNDLMQYSNQPRNRDATFSW
jgi:hypothetical protein